MLSLCFTKLPHHLVTLDLAHTYVGCRPIHTYVCTKCGVPLLLNHELHTYVMYVCTCIYIHRGLLQVKTIYMYVSTIVRPRPFYFRGKRNVGGVRWQPFI